MRRGDVQRRQIRRLENEGGRFMRRCERGRDAGPQRCAHQDDAIAVIASRARLPIGGFAILHQAALRRRTGRAAIAAIGNSENTVAPRRKHAKARNAIDKRAGIAVKYKISGRPSFAGKTRRRASRRQRS